MLSGHETGNYSGTTAHPQFSHQNLQISLDRINAEAEGPCDFFIVTVCKKQFNNFMLPSIQFKVPQNPIEIHVPARFDLLQDKKPPVALILPSLLQGIARKTSPIHCISLSTLKEINNFLVTFQRSLFHFIPQFIIRPLLDQSFPFITERRNICGRDIPLCLDSA